MLTAEEIRRRYLAFFQRHQHEAVASGPLIPPNDKTLLFTNAGMVQFKKCFLGEEKRGYSRATTCQKCLRVSGKHNDLENVGRTARHHTFFEMLGNFSFGDYFKRDAITWAWQFVTEELELPKERLWVTVFRDDDEAAKLWEEVACLPPERIVRMDEHDNFWTMGDTGPCGPCSEIYIDQGEDMSCGPDCGIGKCDCDRFLEIWNLVFTQYDQSADGSRVPLAAPNIDTGMGLERIAAVCQGKRSNFDCDLFQNLIQFAANLAHVSYSESAPDTNDVDTALRVIADHSRSAAFLVAEGVLPSNVGRGYVLRRLIRRALRFATLLGVKEPFLYQVSHRVTEIMGDAYPELLEHADFIKRVVHEEEERFSETLEKGLALLDEELVRLEQTGAKCVSGEFCFTLHDTHGFPLDIVNDVARKRGFSVDETGFEKCMDEQRNRARANQKKGGLLGQAAGNMDAVWQKLVANKVTCSFTGYSGLRASARLTLLLDASGNEIANLGEGEQGYAITDATPFYGESGGQVGDTGLLSSTLGEAQVLATCKPAPSLLVHEVRMVRGELHVGEEVSLEVETERRQAIARNHSCTHLLHAALRKVLGTHVRQMGSLVDAERLRFDFSHIAAMTKEELSQVEHLVNKAILADMPVSVNEMAHDEAVAQGAMALFDEKYGDRVRVVSMGATGEEAESVELCGGTHLSSTGQAGQMVIISESGVAAGIRRIEAVTGWNALQYLADLRIESQNLGQALKSKPGQMLDRVKALQDEVKKLRKAAEKASLGNAESGDLLANAKEINGITLVCATLAVPVKALRTAMDDLRSRLPRLAVACLATNDDGKVGLILYVAKDLHDRFTAPALIKEVAAPIGGSGGGRPDLAQAGGSNVAGIPEAFTTLEKALA